MKRHSVLFCTLLILLGFGHGLADVGDIVIVGGSDYFSITATNVNLDGMDTDQDPSVPDLPFAGVPINPGLLGNAAMVVRRTRDISKSSTDANCADGVPAEVMALSLKSVVPLKFGGVLHDVVVTLPGGTRPQGNVGYVNHGGELLAFLCTQTFAVSAVLSPVGGGTKRTISGQLAFTVDAVVRTDPPLGAVIVPGQYGDLDANWHNPIPSGSNDVFLHIISRLLKAESAVHAVTPIPYRGTFVVLTPKEINEFRRGDRFQVRFRINHSARDSDPRTTMGRFRTDGPDIFELQPPVRLHMTLEQVGGFTEALTRDFTQNTFTEDGLNYQTFLTGDSVVTSQFFPGQTFRPRRFGMHFVGPNDRFTDSGLGQTLFEQQILFSANGLFRPELFPSQTGFLEFFNSRARVDVGGTMENVLIVPETDVTQRLQIVRERPRFDRLTQRFVQRVTLQNIGDSTIFGPIWLVLDSLDRRATLFNKSGDSAPNAGPFLVLNAGTDDLLSRQESVSVVLEFVSPTRADITYTTRALALQSIP